MGNPTKSFVLVLFAITLYLVSLKTPTIICASDSIAFGAMSCLREYGRSIPDDVQVTGTGDSELTLVVTPTLTTVHHHYKTAGKEAARMLVDAMGKTTRIPCEIRLGYEVLAQGSIR